MGVDVFNAIRRLARKPGRVEVVDVGDLGVEDSERVARPAGTIPQPVGAWLEEPT